MTKQTLTRYPVNYDTKWTHYYLDPKQALYFKPKTGIPEIILKLKAHFNKHGSPHLKVDYRSYTNNSQFSRLYRNLCKSYKGWTVSYRKPGSQEDYGPITEKMGVDPNKLVELSDLKKRLSRPMLWKHDLDSVIKPVKIDGIDNCGAMARKLNAQLKEGFTGVLLKEWIPYFDA